MEKEDIEKLFQEVKKSLQYSYCPYSNFAVGACVVSDDKNTYIYGANGKKIVPNSKNMKSNVSNS